MAIQGTLSGCYHVCPTAEFTSSVFFWIIFVLLYLSFVMMFMMFIIHIHYMETGIHLLHNGSNESYTLNTMLPFIVISMINISMDGFFLYKRKPDILYYISSKLFYILLVLFLSITTNILNVDYVFECTNHGTYLVDLSLSSNPWSGE